MEGAATLGKTKTIFSLLQPTIALLVLCGLAVGQASRVPATPLATDLPQVASTITRVSLEGLLSPHIVPDSALKTYQERSVFQKEQLESLSSSTFIHAELPDTAQQGELQVLRQYTAPRTLWFTPLHYDGDPFVKRNVIARVLQSEVARVQNASAEQTALDSTNYKFSFVTTSLLSGRPVHIYQVKPRAKRQGLFKGRIYLDAARGSLVRAEGRLVKTSSSFYVRKVEFLQDYADCGHFTFPVHLHSEARVRVIGRVTVDVYNYDYKAVTSEAHSAPSSVAARESIHPDDAFEGQKLPMDRQK